MDALRDGCDYGVVQNFRIQAMSQRCARLHYNSVLPTEVEQVPLREIWMALDLRGCRLDPGGGGVLPQLIQSTVCQAVRLAFALVHEALERLPRLDQRHSGIIDDLIALVPRVLLVAGPKGKGGVDQIAIDGVDLQPPAAGVESGLHPLRTMIGVPKLSGDEDVLAPNRTPLENFLHRLANCFFIAVALRAIEMSESHFQGCLRRLFGRDRIRDERAKPDRRHNARSIVQWDLCVAKRIGSLHAHTPSSEAGRRMSDGGVRGSVQASDLAARTANVVSSAAHTPSPFRPRSLWNATSLRWSRRGASGGRPRDARNARNSETAVLDNYINLSICYVITKTKSFRKAESGV